MTLLYRWHASIVRGDDRRTAVCAARESDAVIWLRNRVRDARSALMEINEADPAIEELDELAGRLWNATWDNPEGWYGMAIGDETYRITRRSVLSGFGHADCLTIDRWEHNLPSRIFDRWDAWPRVPYSTVS